MGGGFSTSTDEQWKGGGCGKHARSSSPCKKSDVFLAHSGLITGRGKLKLMGCSQCKLIISCGKGERVSEDAFRETHVLSGLVYFKAC